MNDKVLLSFLLCGLYVETCAEIARRFHFVSLNLNWTEAQKYCRTHYTDLATISGLEWPEIVARSGHYLSGVEKLVDAYIGHAWIGLRSTTVVYQNYSRPDYGGSGDNCTGLLWSGEWDDFNCTELHHYVCHGVGKKWYLFRTHRNYSDARAHCIQNYTDLALIESDDENNQVKSLFTNGKDPNVWIHKPRRLWTWSDGSPTNFTNWRLGRPLDDERHNCTVQDGNMFWTDVSCDQTLSFYCNNDTPKSGVNVIKVSFQSDLSMSDPKNYQMLLEKMQKEMNLTGVKLTWKMPPKKKTIKTRGKTTCPDQI